MDFESLEEAEAVGASEEAHDQGDVPSLEDLLRRIDAEEAAVEPSQSAAPSVPAAAIRVDDYKCDEADEPGDSSEELPGRIDAEEKALEQQITSAEAVLSAQTPAKPAREDFPSVIATCGDDYSQYYTDEPGDVPSFEELLGRIDKEEAAMEAMTPAVLLSSVTASVASASTESQIESHGIIDVKPRDIPFGPWTSLNTSENPFLRGKRTPHHILVAQKILRAHQAKQATAAAATGESPPAIANHRGPRSRERHADPEPTRSVAMPEPGVPEKLPGMPTLPARAVFPRRALAIGGPGPSSGQSGPAAAAVPEQGRASQRTASKAVSQQTSSASQGVVEDGVFCAHCGGPVVRPLRCSKCRGVHYCGARCQRADWPAHKKVCKVPETDLRGNTPELPGGPPFSELSKIPGMDQEPSSGSPHVDSSAHDGPSLEEMLAQLDQEDQEEHEGV